MSAAHAALSSMMKNRLSAKLDKVDNTMDSITGEAVDFANYKDTVCLVVNVASR